MPVIHTFNNVKVAHGAPEIVHGHVTSSKQPGLGITLDYKVLGQPEFVITKNGVNYSANRLMTSSKL